MNYNKYTLGNYIEQIDRRNVNMEYGVDAVMGITNTKILMETKARPEYADLSKFYILEPDEFIYNPRTSRNGEKVGMAYNSTGHNILFTFNNIPFRIKPECREILYADYLYLFFLNPEFDRYARYNSWGSATELFPWDEMCRIQIPVPPLTTQRKIAEDYKVITERIGLLEKINKNLEEQALTIFHRIIEGCEKDGCLSDLAIITMGTSPEGETLNDKRIGEVFYQGRTDFGFRFPTVRLYTTDAVRRAKSGDVLMSVRAPVGDVNIAKEDCAIGRGLASIRPKDNCYSFLYYTMKELYCELKRFNDEGTVFGSITKDNLAELRVVLTSHSKRKDFDAKVEPIDICIRNYEFEIAALQGLRSNLLVNLAKGA